MVDLRGLEPLTSALRTPRSPKLSYRPGLSFSSSPSASEGGDYSDRPAARQGVGRETGEARKTRLPSPLPTGTRPRRGVVVSWFRLLAPGRRRANRAGDDLLAAHPNIGHWAGRLTWHNRRLNGRERLDRDSDVSGRPRVQRGPDGERNWRARYSRPAEGRVRNRHEPAVDPARRPSPTETRTPPPLAEPCRSAPSRRPAPP